ncbi:MAG: NAD-dependent epimerase/dehydratase family protein [Deltaproteobacteria bacterium]|nr:NAD-dependent epimerase/dehydratase family protein [Deltaproteobacteria bacterium]
MTATKKVLLTGATGFIGQHVAKELVNQGYKVRALCRSPSEELEYEGVEVVLGDVLDLVSVDAALLGMDFVIHAAGAVSREKGDQGLLMKVHVTGTRIVVGAACRANIKRVVNVSTSGTIAVGDDPDLVFHEEDEVPLGLIHRWPYYLSKFLAERAASDEIRLSDAHDDGKRTELITVNPTLVLGPGDDRASSTTDVRRYLDRQVPVVPCGGLSFVDVRDVATAVVSALTKGRASQRYLLGSVNLTFADFFQRLEEVSGVKGPLVPVAMPKGLARFGVGLLEKVAEKVGIELSVSQTEADMASHFWYVDSRKAEDELEFSPREPMQTLLDTVRDLQA